MPSANSGCGTKEKGSPAKFERDLKLEALVPAVKGELPVLVVADRAREIRNAIEFCDAQKLKMILAGGAEAYKVKDLLKAKSIPVVLRTTQRLPSNEDDPYDQPFTQPAELVAAGIEQLLGGNGRTVLVAAGVAEEKVRPARRDAFADEEAGADP